MDGDVDERSTPLLLWDAIERARRRALVGERAARGWIGTDLPGLAADLLKAYGKTAYRKNFGFIDHMRGEQDPVVIRKLDGKLVKALCNREMTEMHLAIPYGLPFFSLVSMKTAAERLGRAGIEVFAKEIKEI